MINLLENEWGHRRHDASSMEHRTRYFGMSPREEIASPCAPLSRGGGACQHHWKSALSSVIVVLTRAHFLKIVLTFGRATDSPGKLAYACIVNAGHRPAMQQNMMQQNISSSVMLSERVSLALSQPVTALPHVEAEYFAMVRIRTR